MKIEDLLPIDGPSINEVKKYIDKYKNDLMKLDLLNLENQVVQ